MILRTNVKLNLGLRVLGKRQDGFHDIETLFIPWFGMGDEIEILATEGDEPTLNGDISWPAEKDLCIRAWHALKADFDIPAVNIRLSKGAPVGAGLGGGSADAAFTLRGLRDMFGLGLSDERLAEYAASLGSDCAFFIWNRPMIGRGKGEILTPFETKLEEYDIRVVVPQGVSVNTAHAYRDIDALAAAGKTEVGETLEDILRRPVEEWHGRLVNDFEAPVFAAHPEVEALKRRMYEDGAVYAAMSGSGSAVFGIFACGRAL